jgi:hypothetical protein
VLEVASLFYRLSPTLLSDFEQTGVEQVEQRYFFSTLYEQK